MSKVERPSIKSDYVVTESGCWEWQGRVDRNGYGKAYDPSRPRGQRVDWAHRVSYRTHKGEIPPKYEVDHVCCNIICINPEHLDAITKVEHVRRTWERVGKDDLHERAARMRAYGLTFNEIAELLGYSSKTSAKCAVESAIAKGLVDPDDVPPTAFLDASDYADIRELYASGIPQTEIATWYSVDSSQVSRICNGKTSGHRTHSVPVGVAS